MQVRWHGHSCFEISDGNTTIVTDPHDGKSIGISPPHVTADIVLMSHDHYDHNAAWVIQGNHKDHLAHNGKFECKGISFRGYQTYHDDAQGTKRGMNTIYFFEMEGITMCHCGDLGAIPRDCIINRIKNVDLLFLPVGGVYTMENPELKRFIELVSPRIVVPMHFRIGGLSIPVADIDQFLSMVPDENVAYIGNSVEIFKDDLPETKECWVFDR